MTAAWQYHPQELFISGTGQVLALVEAMASLRRVVWISHGQSIQEDWAPQGWDRVESQGGWSRQHRQGHWDLPFQRTAWVDAELALVQGCPPGPGFWIFDTDSGCSDLTNLPPEAQILAAYGEARPTNVPAGGVAWFRRSEALALCEYVLDRIEERLRQRPVLGLALGEASPERDEACRILSDICDGLIFSNTDPGGHGKGGDVFSPATAGEAGLILGALETFDDASIFTLGSGVSPLRARAVLDARNVFATATAEHELDRSTPRIEACLWEPKAKSRLWLARAAGISCPRRALTHSHVELVDPPGAVKEA